MHGADGVTAHVTVTDGSQVGGNGEGEQKFLEDTCKSNVKNMKKLSCAKSELINRMGIRYVDEATFLLNNVQIQRTELLLFLRGRRLQAIFVVIINLLHSVGVRICHWNRKVDLILKSYGI